MSKKIISIFLIFFGMQNILLLAMQDDLCVKFLPVNIFKDQTHCPCVAASGVLGKRVYVIYGFSDGSIHVWEKTGNVQYDYVQTIKQESSYHTPTTLLCEVIGDWMYVIVGFSNGMTNVWKKHKHKDFSLTQSAGRSGGGVSASVCPSMSSKEFVISGYENGHIRVSKLYDICRVLPFAPDHGHAGCVYALTCVDIEDEETAEPFNYVISCACDKTLKVWGVSSDGQVRCVDVVNMNDKEARSLDVVVIRNVPYVISGSCNGDIDIWRMDASGKLEHVYIVTKDQGGHVGCIKSLISIRGTTINDDGIFYFVSHSDDKRIKIWEISCDGFCACVDTFDREFIEYHNFTTVMGGISGGRSCFAINFAGYQTLVHRLQREFLPKML